MAPVLLPSPSVKDTYTYRHCSVISNEVDKSRISEQFSDLIMHTPEGRVPCHRSLLIPLSPSLDSLLASIPTCPGSVPHVVLPLSRDIVQKILQITYTGRIYVKCKMELEQVLSGLDLLDIKLPGLHWSEVQAPLTDTELVIPSVSGGGEVSSCGQERKEATTNNNLVNLPFLSHPKYNAGLQKTIVRLPSKSKVSQPVITKSNLPRHPPSLLQLKTRLAQQLFPLGIDESMQCNVDGCRSLVTLKGLSDHFKSHDLPSVKCNMCNLGFKDKKALEIHRISQHPVVGNNISTGLLIKTKPSDGRTVETPHRINKRVNSAKTEEIETTSSDALVCKLCKISLKSEWHKRRHKCTGQTTPKASPTVKAEHQANLSKTVPDTKQYYCNMCKTYLPSKWYKPPSRHSCSAGSDANKNPEPNDNTDQSLPSTSGARKRSRSMSRPDTSRKQMLLSCQVCTQAFSSLIHLRTHYTRTHYWDKISTQFSVWDRNCYICLKRFPSNNHLREHMGNFHSYVDQCLLADRLLPISVETTIVLLSLKCGLCGVEKSTSSELKSHLAIVHFNKELEREFPCGETGQKNNKCDRCGKIFNNESAKIKHIGSYHDQVLKYAKDTITVYDVDIEYIAENDFEPGQIIITEPFEDADMTKLTNWKSFGLYKRFSSQINHEITQEIPDNSEPVDSYPCPLTSCTRQCGTKSKLLVHLAMSHYLEELEAKFGADCLAAKCSQCDILPNSKLGFIKHMAVEHEIVMTFVERDSAFNVSD